MGSGRHQIAFRSRRLGGSAARSGRMQQRLLRLQQVVAKEEEITGNQMIARAPKNLCALLPIVLRPLVPRRARVRVVQSVQIVVEEEEAHEPAGLDGGG